ncbi:ATP-binding protein [Streptomyces armeniacus]|uniref:ATP-binding protein n=1 Tax=Streptomyces armeniacus TaxID=83291 RepID=A0A345XI08_9ACTN|nr:ATP-binding protein [Streptomyces armeniacus]AXK31274.1 ATP-binding protein [Streptomyces armeniacus]
MTAQHAQTPAIVRTFRQQLSSTRRGARLARRLAAQQLDAWSVPYGSDTSDTVSLIVSELAANAALHGRTRGRDFRLTLAVTDDDRLRIEVSDTRPERLPTAADQTPSPHSESGRGLLLVRALADRWGVREGPPPLKTVWAEVPLPSGTGRAPKCGRPVTSGEG